MKSNPIYLFVTSFFPTPISWRGAYGYDFVKALKETKKYKVFVFMPGKGEDYVYQGIHVYRFPARQLPSSIFPLMFSRWNKKSFLRKVQSIGIDFNDVIVCHGYSGYGVYPLALKSKNPKCLTLLHHHSMSSFGLGLGRLRHFWPHKVVNYLLFRKMHEQIDCHIFISEAVKNSFLSFPNGNWSVYDEYRRLLRGLGFFRGACIKNSFVLHNGVDREIFNQCGRKKHSEFTIGCVSNFNVLKDHMTLLKAISLIQNKLGNWKLRFVGSGECLQECKTFVKEAGWDSRVFFETEMDHKQLPGFYHDLDLFVLPSYFEGFGCVFTEAWACGVPFITCEGQGMDDLISSSERKTWLCKPKSPSDLAKKILFYYEYRPDQHLEGYIYTDDLIREFMVRLEQVRG